MIKINRAASAIALLAMCCAPQLAAQQQDAAVKAKADDDGAKAKDDPIICKEIRLTGSRLNSKRVCKPKSQIEEERTETARDINKATQSKGCTAASPC